MYIRRGGKMKVKILATLLTVSVLFNVAGLVFFICFLKQNKSYRNLKHERNQMAQSLSAVRAATIADDGMSAGQIVRRTFTSLADGTEDVYGLMPALSSNGAQGQTLVVYLHGMGSNHLEPFIYPFGQPIAQAIQNKYPNVSILSCSYRRDASWGNDLAIADINQNIRQILQEFPIKRIILMGTSMGGCTVLTYAATAPADIKEKIQGVVSVEGAGDLKQLYDTSQNLSVRVAMIAALGGTYEEVPGMYQRKSFLTNIKGLNPGVKVAVVSATLDKIMPPRLQQSIAEALEHEGRPVKMISVEAGHGAPPAPIYIEGLDFAMSDSVAGLSLPQ